MSTSDAQTIRLLILDVDGVLSDGGLIFDEDGRQYKRFDVKDGLGLKLLQNSGVEIAIISSRESKAVTQRAAELNIRHLYQGQANKLQAYQHLKQALQLHDQQIAYVGDDLPDLPVMRRVGLAIAVADAAEEVKHHAAWVSQARGGHGAVREICERLLRTQGQFERVIQPFLSAHE